MHRTTKKSDAVNKKMQNWRDAKERNRKRYAEERCSLLPDLRMRITVERFDCGENEKHVFELKKGKRVDMYRVFVDDEPWKHCGLSGVLEGIRKALPRVLAEFG